MDGERYPRERHDLILSPTGLWRGHGHAGDWYAVEGQRQDAKPGRGDAVHARRDVVPTPVFGRSAKASPMPRHPWAEVRVALQALAADRPDEEAVQVNSVNPETGADLQSNLGFRALVLRLGQVLTLPPRSLARVFHSNEDAAEAEIGDTHFALGYTPVRLHNRLGDVSSFFFIAGEGPLHGKPGVYERV